MLANRTINLLKLSKDSSLFVFPYAMQSKKLSESTQGKLCGFFSQLPILQPFDHNLSVCQKYS